MTNGILKITVHIILILSCISGINYAADAQKPKTWSIVIDPGHGGKDPGAVGGKVKEKDITLAIALELGKHLACLENTNVIYTRKTDVAVELHKRARIAVDNKADLFISIHCNSVESSKPYGAETWIMGLHKSKANLEVAKAENAVILLEDDYQAQYDGFDPNSPEGEIIFSLYQNTFMEQSVNLASLIQKEIKTNAQRFDRGVKQAGFWVLYKTNMPGVLIEAGFLSNENERKYLNSDTGQKTIALSIYNAVIQYRTLVDGRIPSRKDGCLTFNNAPAETSTFNTQKDSSETTAPPLKTQQITSSTVKNSVNNNPKPPPPEIYFAVQFLTTTKPHQLSDPCFAAIEEVHFYQQDGSYRYVSGYFTSLSEASQRKKEIAAHQYPDAFVVAFQNGKRISTSEASRILKKK